MPPHKEGQPAHPVNGSFTCFALLKCCKVSVVCTDDVEWNLLAPESQELCELSVDRPHVVL